jgi:hypothetical protein
MHQRRTTGNFTALCLLVVTTGCTFGVQELTDTRSASFDKPGWNTFVMRATDMTGGLTVVGTPSTGLIANATVAALLSLASKDEAFGGASLGFVHDGSQLRLTLATSGDHAELIYFQKLAIESPATVNLDIEADDSNVTVSDMAGNVVVSTGSGRATVTTGGSTEIRASSGAVTAAVGFKATVDGGSGAVNVVAGSILDLKTSSGSVQADTPTGGKVRTDGGDVDLRLTDPGFGATSIDSGAGDVILQIPIGAKYDLDAFSETGVMVIEVGGLLLTEPYNGPVNGGGPLVTVRTTTGSVTIITE